MKTVYKGIKPGTEIVDKHGHKVGTVHQVYTNESDQLHGMLVQKGLLFKHDVAIPADTIERIEHGVIHLRVDKADLVEMLKPTLEPPPQGQVPNTGLVTPRTVEREAATGGQPIPEVQPGVVAEDLNGALVRPDVIHDVSTGAWTHDRGIGSAGVAGPESGPAPAVTGGEWPDLPAQAEEPTGRERT